MLFFSCGALELVAPVAYSLVPGMPYFRHVGLTAAFVKLFVIFLAGFGFERSLRALPAERRGMTALGLLLLAIAILLGTLAASSENVLHRSFAVIRTGMPLIYSSPDFQSAGFLARTFAVSAIAAGISGALLLAARRARSAGTAWILILGFHALHLAGWKLEALRQKTQRLSPEQAAVQELAPVPYVARRTTDYAAFPRYRAMESIVEPSGGSYATMYWTADSYLFVDAPSSKFRTTDWMLPLDELMRAYSGQPPRDRSQRLAASEGWMLRFPMNHPAAARVVGRSVDKLQVFSDAHVQTSSEEIAKRLTDPEYRGDLLFVEGTETSPDPALGGSDRVEAAFQVLEFDANHLRVKTTVQKSAWLLYCDVWHPGWTAQVNGRTVPLKRAQIAYKAVPLDAGDNVVEFRFRAPVRAACFVVVSLHSAACILIVAALAFRLCRT
jgi:hypothetical protein